MIEIDLSNNYNIKPSIRKSNTNTGENILVYFNKRKEEIIAEILIIDSDTPVFNTISPER